jgi:hypothetical protein
MKKRKFEEVFPSDSADELVIQPGNSSRKKRILNEMRDG